MQATPVRWMPLAPGLTYRSVRAPAVSSHGFLNRVTLQAHALSAAAQLAWVYWGQGQWALGRNQT